MSDSDTVPFLSILKNKIFKKRNNRKKRREKEIDHLIARNKSDYGGNIRISRQRENGGNVVASKC